MAHYMHSLGKESIFHIKARLQVPLHMCWPYKQAA